MLVIQNPPHGALAYLSYSYRLAFSGIEASGKPGGFNAVDD